MSAVDWLDDLEARARYSTHASDGSEASDNAGHVLVYDVPRLVAEVRRLRRLIDCDWRGLDDLIGASPTLRAYLAAIRGNVEALAARAADAETERDQLATQVDAVEALAADACDCGDPSCVESAWRDRLRAALDTTTKEETTDDH